MNEAKGGEKPRGANEAAGTARPKAATVTAEPVSCIAWLGVDVDFGKSAARKWPQREKLGAAWNLWKENSRIAVEGKAGTLETKAAKGERSWRGAKVIGEKRRSVRARRRKEAESEAIELELAFIW